MVLFDNLTILRFYDLSVDEHLLSVDDVHALRGSGELAATEVIDALAAIAVDDSGYPR